MANMLKPKVVCINVNLYKLFNTTEALTSLRTSIVTRIPSRSDSSLTSVIPSIFFSRANSAIRSIKRALFTMYGNSCTTICCFPLACSSISTLARKVTVPLPVSYAFLIPDFPITIAPVGKSGPGIASIKSAVVTSGFFINI